MRLTDRYPQKRAFVTGAAHGFGLALARTLAAEGWTVGLADLDTDALPGAAEQVEALGGHAFPVPLDVTDAAAFGKAAAGFVDQCGGADLVINSAGIAAAGRFEDIPAEDFDATVAVDLGGVANGCRAFAPYLREAGARHLVNVASAAAVAAAPYMAPYNAAKAGVVALSETLYGELAGAGVHVAVVMPTFFKTGIAEAQRSDEAFRQLTRRLMENSGLSAEEAARRTLRAAGKDRIHILFPWQAKWVWHLKRFFPAIYMRRLTRRFEQARDAIYRLRDRDGGEG
jgi:NAD(P)-dependent dehydrogenase (short-subunit alcohol dehydrogenase family)